MDSTNRWYNYLTTERKLSPAIVTMAGLDVHNDLLKIPVRNAEGEVIFNKYRRAPWSPESVPKYQYDVGASVSLYGIEHLTDTLVITEGELDSLALMSCGYNAVSSTGGSLSFQKSWADIFKERSVTVMFDNDDAGIKGAVRTALILQTCVYRWVPPRYGKDIGEVLQNYGVDTVKELMTRDDNKIAVNVPELTQKKQILEYRRRLMQQVRTMTTGSIGACFLRALIVQVNTVLSEYSRPVRSAVRYGDETSRAKAFPISYVLKVENRKAQCPFHDEKTASMHIYDDNHAFCFGACHKRYDVIDIYMQVHQCTFKEALRELAK